MMVMWAVAGGVVLSLALTACTGGGSGHDEDSTLVAPTPLSTADAYCARIKGPVTTLDAAYSEEPPSADFPKEMKALIKRWPPPEFLDQPDRLKEAMNMLAIGVANFAEKNITDRK